MKSHIKAVIGSALIFGISSALCSNALAASFSDLNSEHWAFGYVSKLSSCGVISGYADGSFRPEVSLSRAEWAKLLCESAGLSKPVPDGSIADVSSDAWYAPFVYAVSPYLPCLSDGGFHPAELVSRADVASSIVRAVGLSPSDNASAALTAFSDVSADTANSEYIALAVSEGIIGGFEDGTLRLSEPLTRAQAAAVLARTSYFSFVETSSVSFDNGDSYTGALVDGKRQGYGVYSYANGMRYEGSWVNDDFGGQGTLFFPDGSVLSADWVNGLANGFGTLSFTNGDRYEGQFVDSLKSGHGVYYYAGGNRYDGEWLNDLKHGFGIMYYAYGDRFEGTFVDGKRSGSGVHYFANGDRYEGTWSNDERVLGGGVYYYADGNKFDGVWNHDIP